MTDPSEFIENLEKFLEEPTDDELNKEIHRILGRCWHEFVPSDDTLEWICNHCNKKETEIGNSINFLTWEGFGVLWEFMQKQPGWYTFWHHYWHTNLINPHALAEAVVEFFKEEAK